MRIDTKFNIKIENQRGELLIGLFDEGKIIRENQIFFDIEPFIVLEANLEYYIEQWIDGINEILRDHELTLTMKYLTNEIDKSQGCEKCQRKISITSRLKRLMNWKKDE